MASLVSSGTTRGEPPFVPRSASIASELAGQVTGIGCLAPNRLSEREPREGSIKKVAIQLTDAVLSAEDEAEIRRIRAEIRLSE
jgi:hypothetical protein